jgi:hypothetical protein
MHVALSAPRTRFLVRKQPFLRNRPKDYKTIVDNSEWAWTALDSFLLTATRGIPRNCSREVHAGPPLPARQHKPRNLPCPPHLKSRHAAQRRLRLTTELSHRACQWLARTRLSRGLGLTPSEKGLACIHRICRQHGHSQSKSNRSL